MIRNASVFSLVGASFAALSLVGCGGRDPNLPKLEPVSGTVTLDGRPLANASVTFVPSGTTRGTGATGVTGPDGKYTLMSRGEPGVPAGDYRVVVSKLVLPDGSDFPLDADVPPIESNAREMLPPHYSDEAASNIAKTVPEGGGIIDIQLERTSEQSHPEGNPKSEAPKPETNSESK